MFVSYTLIGLPYSKSLSKLIEIRRENLVSFSHVNEKIKIKRENEEK